MPAGSIQEEEQPVIRPGSEQFQQKGGFAGSERIGTPRSTSLIFICDS
jgi:hypothetical protein